MVALAAADPRLLPGGGRRRPPFLALPRRTLRARDQCATLVRTGAVRVNNQQHSTRFDGRSDIFVAKYVIGGARRQHVPTCAFDRIEMLTKSCSRIRHGFLDCLPS